MKTLFDGTMEIITPCFCAGADQTKAEIRAPSIRGELRWWFRALGGTREQEAEIFGSIEAKDKNRKELTKNQASALIVRVSHVQPAKAVQLPRNLNNAPDDPFYLLYFAKASANGIRYQEKGYFSPGTTFHLQIVARRPIADMTLLQKTLEVFQRFGSIGLRSNRACGAWCLNGQLETVEDLKKWAASLPKSVEVSWLMNNGELKTFNDWDSAFRAESQILRSLRKNGYSAGKSGNQPTPLGRSKPRQGSAVRLRPVKLMEGFLPMVIYVPGVLGTECQDDDFKISGVEVGLDDLETLL